jgi:hypothetical protein
MRKTGRLLVAVSLIAGLMAFGGPSLAAEAEVEVAWTCESAVIEITSTKGISNLVLVVDGVEVRWFEAAPEADEIRSYTIDPETVGGEISGVYVKSGSNSDAGDVGVGEFFPLAEPDCGLVCEPAIQFADPAVEATVRAYLGIPDGPITSEDALLLTSLSLAGRGVTDLGGIGCFANLRSLNLAGNQISDISELALLTNLFILIMDQNQITDVSPVAGLTQLRLLSFSNNQVSDISSLGNLTLLSLLTFINNQVSDISVVSGLTSLQRLRGDGNDFADLRPVEGLQFLRTVTVQNTLISAVDPLLTLLSLSYVDIRGTLIDCDDPSVLQLLAGEAYVLSDCP